MAPVHRVHVMIHRGANQLVARPRSLASLPIAALVASGRPRSTHPRRFQHDYVTLVEIHSRLVARPPYL